MMQEGEEEVHISRFGSMAQLLHQCQNRQPSGFKWNVVQAASHATQDLFRPQQFCMYNNVHMTSYKTNPKHFIKRQTHGVAVALSRNLAAMRV